MICCGCARFSKIKFDHRQLKILIKNLFGYLCLDWGWKTNESEVNFNFWKTDFLLIDSPNHLFLHESQATHYCKFLPTCFHPFTKKKSTSMISFINNKYENISAFIIIIFPLSCSRSGKSMHFIRQVQLTKYFFLHKCWQARSIIIQRQKVFLSIEIACFRHDNIYLRFCAF